MLDLGADVNAANEAGQTALHAAAAIGANGVVRFLVERGARLDARTRQGRTPLDEALRGVPNIDGAPGEAHEDTAAMLRELMAQRGLDVKPAALAPAPRRPRNHERRRAQRALRLRAIAGAGPHASLATRLPLPRGRMKLASTPASIQPPRPRVARHTTRRSAPRATSAI